MKSISLFSLLLVSGLLCAAQQPKKLPASMDSIFRSFNNSSGPGCAVSIIRNGKVIFEKGYGLANLDYDVPIGTQTIFDIASVSKQFTGFAISTLIQEGRISPEDDIHQYLPDLPQFGQKITIRNLIHHTSGLRDWPGALHIAGWLWDDIFSFADIMRMVKHQQDLDFEPGAKFSYSNTGYNLLAAIIEKVTGKTLREWEEEHIFKVLGMNATQVQDNYNRVIRQRAVSYYPQDNGFRAIQGCLTAYGSSSIFSSVSDLDKWAIHFIKAIRAKDPLFTRMLEIDTLSKGDAVPYGYGLEVRKVRGVNTISHDGGWQGFRTLILHFPDDDLSLVLLSNHSDFNPTVYAYQVASLFLKDRLLPEPPSEDMSKLPTIPVDTALIKSYTGTFQLSPGWYVTCTLENGRLMVQATGENKFPTEAKSDSVFWVPAYGSAMHFIREGNGKVNQLHYRTYTAPRVTLILHSGSELPQYTGSFYSKELETVYQISIVKDRLTLHQMRLGDFTLDPDPAERDQFSSPLGAIHFLRQDKRPVTGLTISGGRVKNIRFDKQ